MAGAGMVGRVMISGQNKLSPFGATTAILGVGRKLKWLRGSAPEHPIFYICSLHDISIPSPSIVKEILRLLLKL